MIKIKAKYTDHWVHVSVLIVGLRLLQEGGQIDLELVKEDDGDKNNQAGMEMIVDNIKVYLDVSDGYNNLPFMEKHIEDYDIWFKRSYSPKLNEQYGFTNVEPLGLNYEVFDKYVSQLFGTETVKTILMRMFGMKPEFEITSKDYEFPPRLNDIPQICFCTRLWGGNQNRSINEMRITLVRALKKEYGSRFHGGIYNSKEAEELCPDLIVSKVYTQKSRYLSQMKRCDICIATTGLHDSIGWKFAEYVMASKVILTEPLNYFVPYGFEAGKNYFEFTSVENCIQLIDDLLRNHSRMQEIMQNNNQYYREYLNAKSMMLKIVEKCIKREKADYVC